MLIDDQEIYSLFLLKCYHDTMSAWAHETKHALIQDYKLMNWGSLQTLISQEPILYINTLNA